MTPEKSRRERAIERAHERDHANMDAPDPLPWNELLLECYEDELAADIECDDVVQRALSVSDETLSVRDFGDSYFRECWPDLMRAVLRTILEPR